MLKNLPAEAGDTDLIPWSGRSPGEGNVNPLQCSCLEDSMDREAWQATDHGIEKSRTQLTNTFTLFSCCYITCKISDLQNQVLMRIKEVPVNHKHKA